MRKIRKITALMMIGCLLVLSAAGCGKKEVTIKIASKPMTEQFILTEMMKALIEENTDLKVEITKGVGGGTTNIHPAMLNKEFDLYPEYTRTAWFSVLKMEENPEDSALYEQLQEKYSELGLTFTGLFGFNNTYSIAIRKETAEEYGIKTYSDLAAVSDQLVFGGNYDYIEKEDGYPLLCEAYQMNFKETVDMEIALKYSALLQKDIDVTNAFITDAQLSNPELVLLEDDQKFFATYLAGCVARKEVLEQNPELLKALELMNGLITDSDMAAMNYAVEVDGKEDVAVAREFLQSKGLIK